MKLENQHSLGRGTTKLLQLQDEMGFASQNDENSNSRMNSDASLQVNNVYTKQAAVKHYEVPNLSSMLYEYTNREKDYVERAFRGGSYQTIRALPDDIRPFNVGQSVKERIAGAALTSSIIGQNNDVY